MSHDGILVSTDSDWGDGEDDNLADDVAFERGASYSGLPPTFTCEEATDICG